MERVELTIKLNSESYWSICKKKLEKNEQTKYENKAVVSLEFRYRLKLHIRRMLPLSMK